MGGQRGDSLLQGFQRNRADAEPRRGVGGEHGVHNGGQIALAAADEHGIRRRPVRQRRRGQPLCKVQILHSKFCAVFAYQAAGFVIALGGIDLPGRGGQRQLNADTAGSRAHVPQDVSGAHGQLGQHRGAHLLLGHRRFAAEEGIIRQARHAAGGGRAWLDQQHAQRRKLLLCQRGYGVRHKAF